MSARLTSQNFTAADKGKRNLRFFLVLMLASLTACTTWVNVGHEIDYRQVLSFKKGETTVAEVEKTFGNPENVVRNTMDNTLVYNYQYVTDRTVGIGILPWLFYGTKADSGYQLNVAFANGVYQGYTFNLMNQALVGKNDPVDISAPLYTDGHGASTEKQGAQTYGIYTAKLDGSDFKLLIADPKRELNHARVSSDKKVVTFTRYNHLNALGVAEETGGYDLTELRLVGIDGKGDHALTDPENLSVAANGNWSFGDKKIIFVGKKKSGNFYRVLTLDLNSKAVSENPGLPSELNISDPHQVGNWLVFGARQSEPKQLNVLYLQDLKSLKYSQITFPEYVPAKREGDPPPGDYDPKISHDGKKIAFFRHKGDSWLIVVYNIASHAERVLSENNTVDAVPEWSSDDRLLIYWHVDPTDLAKSGLYTMKPDGSARVRIPLPRGYFYTMPAFFPGEGSEPSTRIIFSAKMAPGF